MNSDCELDCDDRDAVAGGMMNIVKDAFPTFATHRQDGTTAGGGGSGPGWEAAATFVVLGAAPFIP
jgi:hypothetical protein